MLWSLLSCLAQMDAGSPEGSGWGGGCIAALAAQLLRGEMGPISPGQPVIPVSPRLWRIKLPYECFWDPRE